jgi:hypothetical protein
MVKRKRQQPKIDRTKYFCAEASLILGEMNLRDARSEIPAYSKNGSRNSSERLPPFPSAQSQKSHPAGGIDKYEEVICGDGTYLGRKLREV